MMIWKAKPKWVQAIFTFKLQNKVPKKVFLKSRGADFLPFFSFCMHTCHFTSPRCSHAGGLTTSRTSTTYCEWESEKGKDSWSNCPKLWLTLSCGIHWKFAPAGSLTLCFFFCSNTFKPQTTFLIWCIIVQYMSFPHIVEIIMLTTNTHSLRKCLLLSQQGDTWTL